MTDKKQPSQTLPRSGHVRKLRQEWVLKEDQVLAENLQDEEIKTHIGAIQKKHSIIRQDVLHARIEQTREDEIAATSIKTKEELLAEQEYKDYLYARELERQEREARENEKRERKSSNNLPEKKQPKSRPKHIPGNVDDEEERRRIQIEQDEELSRKLQSMNMKQRGDHPQGEKLLAIEAKDYELAKMLQDVENARLKEMQRDTNSK